VVVFEAITVLYFHLFAVYGWMIRNYQNNFLISSTHHSTDEIQNTIATYPLGQ